MEELVRVEGITLDHERHHPCLAARFVLLAGLPEGRLAGCNGRALRFWPAHPSLARHHQKELARRRLMRAHTSARRETHTPDLYVALQHVDNAVDRHVQTAKLGDRSPMRRAKAVESHATLLSMYLSLTLTLTLTLTWITVTRSLDIPPARIAPLCCAS